VPLVANDGSGSKAGTSVTHARPAIQWAPEGAGKALNRCFGLLAPKMPRSPATRSRAVPASWIDAATSRQIGIASDFYSYFFWLGRSLINRHEIQWAAAIGLGGQRVFIVPELDPSWR
jgi:hypothetical protein